MNNFGLYHIVKSVPFVPPCAKDLPSILERYALLPAFVERMGAE